MVQLPEQLELDSEAHKQGYKNIADIGKERIRRVIKKIKEENNKEDIQKLDLGFKVFKLDKSNFRVWDSTSSTGEDIVKQLELHLDELIDKNSSEEGILYELLLKLGYEITTKIKILTLSNKKVYSIGEDNALLICLDRKLSIEVILEMAKLKPSRTVFLDSGFENNDQLQN